MSVDASKFCTNLLPLITLVSYYTIFWGEKHLVVGDSKKKPE